MLNPACFNDGCESGGGTSFAAKKLNNHFGIVGKNNIPMKNGKRSRYKQYASANLSYFDFCRIISRKRFYPSLKGNNRAAAWIDAISKADYSEAPTVWRNGVTQVIRENKLEKLSSVKN
mgnify:CR=1 FL=1